MSTSQLDTFFKENNKLELSWCYTMKENGIDYDLLMQSTENDLKGIFANPCKFNPIQTLKIINAIRQTPQSLMNQLLHETKVSVVSTEESESVQKLQKQTERIQAVIDDLSTRIGNVNDASERMQKNINHLSDSMMQAINKHRNQMLLAVQQTTEKKNQKLETRKEQLKDSMQQLHKVLTNHQKMLKSVDMDKKKRKHDILSETQCILQDEAFTNLDIENNDDDVQLDGMINDLQLQLKDLFGKLNASVLRGTTMALSSRETSCKNTDNRHNVSVDNVPPLPPLSPYTMQTVLFHVSASPPSRPPVPTLPPVTPKLAINANANSKTIQNKMDCSDDQSSDSSDSSSSGDSSASEYEPPRTTNSNASTRQQTQSKKLFACTDCGRTFVTANSVAQHRRVIHGGLKPFACPHCDARFGYKQSVRNHIQQLHRGMKEHCCRHCRKPFLTASALKAHDATCQIGAAQLVAGKTRAKAHLGQKCGKDSSATHLKWIKKGHCVYPGCGKVYTDGDIEKNVMWHLVRVHQDRRYANYECEKCGKLFRYPHEYNNHWSKEHKIN